MHPPSYAKTPQMWGEKKTSFYVTPTFPANRLRDWLRGLGGGRGL